MPRKNTPIDLADALFTQIERLDNDNLTGDALTTEIERSRALCQLSTQVIANGRLALDVYRTAHDNGDRLTDIPNILGGATTPRRLNSGPPTAR